MNPTLSILFLLLPHAGATSFVEDFKSSAYIDSSTSAVVNLATNRLYLPQFVDRTKADATLSEEDALTVGKGGMGEFSTSTFSRFDPSATSSLVTLSTITPYEFTSFTLDSNVTLMGSGSSPLEIRVQGNVTIKGRIDLRGGNGASVSSDTSSTPAGGMSCCGGGSGGSASQSGTSADSGNTGRGIGGSRSTTAGNGSGGGGGGGYESGAAAASSGDTPAGGGTGGAAGATYGDTFLLPLTGGSGGGGGGAYTLGGAANSVGGGGGGGGSVLKITAGGDIQIDPSGEILLKGGNGGGSSSTTLLAGSGGGGAGGTLLLLAGGRLINIGTVDARRGTAGSGSGGGNGGSGAVGRTRFVDSTNDWTQNSPQLPVLEDPTPGTLIDGRVFYSRQPYTVDSTSIDTRNSSPTYVSFTALDTKPAGSTIQYLVAGSNDAFQADSTGFINASLISEISGKRYFKYRIILQTTDRSVSPEVRRVQIDYTEHEEVYYEFSLSGCAIVQNRRIASHPSLFLLFIVLIASLPPFLTRLVSCKMRK